MKQIKSEILSDSYYEIDHESGLKIFVMPKENYSSTYAIFGTKYGSIDNRFKRSDKKEWTSVPEGIAHFLEHKLFESEDLDAFTRYAKTGASANAYTSFDKTCYLFKCSDNFEASLEILLDFVTHPYFTAKTVEKEQGIIGQEITMYYDDPGWMSTFNLLKCLYKNHPVRIDIAGTVDSISKITDKLLYDCYDTFYNLNNMCLAVVGDVTPQQVVKMCDKMLKKAPEITIERNFENEPREIVKDYEEYHLAMNMPVFAFGYKEDCEKPEQNIKTVTETSVLLEILAGDTSDLYNEMFEAGLINASFSKEYFTGYGYEAILFEGESENPKAVSEKIKEAVAKLKKEGITDERFETARRSLYGKEIMNYNYISYIANNFINTHFSGWNSIFDILDAYKTVTKEDVEKRLNCVMDEKYSALSVVKSK